MAPPFFPSLPPAQHYIAKQLVLWLLILFANVCEHSNAGRFPTSRHPIVACNSPEVFFLDLLRGILGIPAPGLPRMEEDKKRRNKNLSNSNQNNNLSNSKSVNLLFASLASEQTSCYPAPQWNIWCWVSC
jgi:hypothetical protein